MSSFSIVTIRKVSVRDANFNVKLHIHNKVLYTHKEFTIISYISRVMDIHYTV